MKSVKSNQEWKKYLFSYRNPCKVEMEKGKEFQKSGKIQSKEKKGRKK